MSAAVLRDNPWPRLSWTLPSAALLCALSLGGFVRLLSMGHATHQHERINPPLTIQADLVTMPAPARAAPPPPIAAPVPPPSPPPPSIPEMRPTPIPEVVRPPPPPVVRREPPPRPRPQPQPQAQPQTTTEAPASPSVATAPAADAARSLAAGQMGARAIYRPLPEFPAELRRQRIEAVAVARFHVAADGSAEVEMVQATDNVTLNRLLMTTFKTWRFFPALENGKPVGSTIEIRVPISIQ